MKKIIFTMLLLTMTTLAQNVEEIKNAPGEYDVKTIDSSCYAVYKKQETKVFQMIEVSQEDGGSSTCSGNVEREDAEPVEYDQQTEIFIDDYNFDGLQDLALFEGNLGGYGAPSYQIFLFSKATNKFVKDDKFSKLTGLLGMFELNKRNKMLYVYSKDGCCSHTTEGYKIVDNKPFKVYEHTAQGAIENAPGVITPEVITKKLIDGKWRTWNRTSATQVSFDKGKTSKTISVKLTENEPIKWLKVGATKGQLLTVTKNSADADVSVVDFRGDVGFYESNEPVNEGENFPVKLNGKGDYYLEVSAEKDLNVSLTIKIEKSVPANYLVTATSVGDIKLGMTIGEAQKVLPKGLKIAPGVSDYGSTSISVFEGSKSLFTIGSYDESLGSDKLPSSIDDQKITSIEIEDPRYKTAEGVYVGMKLADAEKRYGSVNLVKHGVTSDYEGHSFIRQPKYLTFSFEASNEPDSTSDNWLVGIYNEGGQKCKTYDEQQTCTTKYKPGSYISGMGINADLSAD